MFNLQLANTYNPTKNYGVNSWWTSPKLDGVRGLYIADQGLMSRSQKVKYAGLEHIENACKEIAALGYQVIDGELYIPGEKFDVISGIVRKTKKYDINQKLRVQFRIFALWSESKGWVNTEEMIQTIASVIPTNQTAVVALPYTQISSNPVDIQSQNQFNKDSGASGEGTMLRHPDVAYNLGRSNHLLKVKNFEKSEFTIKGFSKGTGKYKNSLGKLTVEGTVNGISINAKVGTGFTDAERQDIWNNQQNYLDRKAEIIYMSATSSGALRSPVFSNLKPNSNEFPSREINPIVNISNGFIQIKLGNQLDEVKIKFDSNNPPPAIKIIWDGQTLVDERFKNFKGFQFRGQANVTIPNKTFEEWSYDHINGYSKNPEPYKEATYQYSIENLDVPETFSLEGRSYFYDGSYGAMTTKTWTREWNFRGQRICYVTESYRNNPLFHNVGSTSYSYSNPIIDLTLNQIFD